MNAKIRTYITRAFEDVPKTKKSIEMQEELISNLNEKFSDQVASGKTEDEAYTMVIAGIGDLSELTEGLIERHVLSAPNQQQRQRNALFITIAVMLYIMSPMMVIFCAEILKADVLGVILMFTLIAIATGLLVYNFNSRPKYIKESETMIEEFKEWKSAKDKNKSLFDALNSAFWLIVVAVYLYISIMYGWWLFSWIIFIIASAVKNIFKAIYDLMRYSNEGK
jgi:uncharacterized membrane protein